MSNIFNKVQQENFFSIAKQKNTYSEKQRNVPDVGDIIQSYNIFTLKRINSGEVLIHISIT